MYTNNLRRSLVFGLLHVSPFTRQLSLSAAVRTLLQFSVLSSLVRRAGFAFWFSLFAVCNAFAVAVVVVLFLAPKFQFRPVWLPMNAWPAGLVCAVASRLRRAARCGTSHPPPHAIRHRRNRHMDGHGQCTLDWGRPINLLHCHNFFDIRFGLQFCVARTTCGRWRCARRTPHINHGWHGSNSIVGRCLSVFVYVYSCC